MYKRYQLIVEPSHESRSFCEALTLIAQDRFSSERLLKHDGTTTVTLVKINSEQYVVKRYNTKNRLHFIRRLFQQSRAINCWNMSKIFNHASIQTPDRIAVIQERLGPFKLRSWFVNRYLEGDDLLAYLGAPSKGESQVATIARLNALMPAVQTLFSSLVRHKISHGDLKATNIIVSNIDHALVLIDLDAAQLHLNPSRFNHAIQKDWHRFTKNWQGNHPILDILKSNIPFEEQHTNV